MSKKYDNSEYSGAGRGVRLVFAATIIQLVATVLGVVATIAAAGSGILALTDTSDAAELGAVFIVSSLLGVLCLIAEVVAYILYLVGLGKARNAEPHLQSAFMLAIFGLICVIVGAILTLIPGVGTAASTIGTTVSNVVNILVVIFVCGGCAELLEGLGEDKLIKKATSTSGLYTIAFASAVFVDLLGTWAFSSQSTVVIILEIVTLILKLIAFIFYLGFLGKTKKVFLAEAKVQA